MNLGQLQQVGTPDDVYDRPSNLFVAQFMGSPPMNTLPVTRVDGHLVSEAGWRFPMPVGMRVPDGELTLGLRPEDIVLAPEGQPATVFVSEPLGNEVIVNVHVGQTLVKLRAAPSVRPTRGEQVFLRADVGRRTSSTPRAAAGSARRCLEGHVRQQPRASLRARAVRDAARRARVCTSAYDYSDRIASDPLLSGGNTLDIGLFDPRGIAPSSPGFRGLERQQPTRIHRCRGVGHTAVSAPDQCSRGHGTCCSGRTRSGRAGAHTP